MIQKDRIRLVGEQVDRWGGVKGETFLPHPRGRKREIPELEPEFETVPFSPFLPPLEPGEVEEEELLRGEEIFLQDPVT